MRKKENGRVRNGVSEWNHFPQFSIIPTELLKQLLFKKFWLLKTMNQIAMIEKQNTETKTKTLVSLDIL